MSLGILSSMLGQHSKFKHIRKDAIGRSRVSWIFHWIITLEYCSGNDLVMKLSTCTEINLFKVEFVRLDGDLKAGSYAPVDVDGEPEDGLVSTPPRVAKSTPTSIRGSMWLEVK